MQSVKTSAARIRLTLRAMPGEVCFRFLFLTSMTGGDHPPARVAVGDASPRVHFSRRVAPFGL